MVSIMNGKIRILIFMALLIVFGCSKAPRVINICKEFINVSVPILKSGRSSASIVANAEKVVIKFDKEISKHGIKISGSLPLSDFESVASAVYSAYTGKKPEAEFDKTQGIFVIVNHKGARTVFVSENNQLCIANISNPAIFKISISSRFIEIPVENGATDVMFGASEQECNLIHSEILSKQKENQSNMLQKAVTLLGIQDAVVESDNDTGQVVLRVNKNGRITETKFYPLLFANKNNIDDKYIFARYIKNARQNIESCTIQAIDEKIGNYVDLLKYRAKCLKWSGYDENDQIFIEVKGLIAA